MSKLQSITRMDGSQIFMVYIPSRLIDELGWEKGEKIEPSVDVGAILLTRG